MKHSSTWGLINKIIPTIEISKTIPVIVFYVHMANKNMQEINKYNTFFSTLKLNSKLEVRVWEVSVF